MATASSVLPPIDKIFMIGLWVESVLYGINSILYGLCMFVLLRGRKAADLRWVLIVMSTILFFLCTAHVGISLQQLLDAFVYAPAGVPGYSTIYWLDSTSKLSVFKNILYDSLACSQDFILIWRLYVVYAYDWRVIVFPLILEVATIGSAYAASALISMKPGDAFHASAISSLIISAWALGFTLNVTVMAAIVVRLWWMDRSMASLTGRSSNRFTSSIYVVIESGTIFVVTTTVFLVLFALKNPVALTGLDISSQVAALTPLLIVVQVGLTSRTHKVPSGDPSTTICTGPDGITFRERIPRDSCQDLPPNVTLARIPSSIYDDPV